MTDVPEISVAERVAAATAALWQHAHHVQVDRASVVESAVMTLLEGRLEDAERATAERAAHKIAGSAGTFGFPRASEIGRELEILLAGRPEGAESGLRAAALIEELQALLAAAHPSLPASPGRGEVGTDPASPSDAPTVLVMHPGAEEAADLASATLVRGLVPALAADLTAAWARLEERGTPAAAVIQIPSGGHAGVETLISELHQRGTAVVAVVAPEADTATRVAALRAGAQMLMDPVAGTGAGAALIADAAASLVADHADVVFRVLAVDDDHTVLLAVRDLLDDGVACQVEILSDPVQFWEVLSRVKPDLVILDLDMPGVSGLELCRLLRIDPRWSQLPVVFLSASSDEVTIRQVYAAGADDFVLKPVAAPELRARVGNRLERSRLHLLMAETDPLTGLANRRRLERDLGRLELLADRFDTPLCLAVVDVDHFKQHNDHYGHAVGDQVLRRLATHLRAAFRGEDAIARVGGDEFIVVMLGMRREDAVERLRGVLHDFAATQDDQEGGSATVSSSAGVAEHRRDGLGFEALYRTADAALRVAKVSGAGHVLPAGESRSSAGGVDIAIVEDDEVLAELLRHALTTAGYRCAVLPDGLTAINRLTDASDPLRPAGVLLDIDLPGRSGYEVLHALRLAGITERTAVVVLTARSSEHEAMRALRGGAADHIAKPFSVPMLVQKLHRLVPVRP